MSADQMQPVSLVDAVDAAARQAVPGIVGVAVFNPGADAHALRRTWPDALIAKTGAGVYARVDLPEGCGKAEIDALRGALRKVKA